MNELNDKILKAVNDPGAMVRLAMDTLEAATGGSIDIPDPSNPFMHNLEFAAVLSSTLATHSEYLFRRQYQALATNREELYYHMSDVDYMGLFATPSQCNFTFYFKKASIINSAVLIEGTETKKLVIPKNTRIMISETEFILHYPIEIRIMAHGGIRIVYDTTEHSPLETISGNSIPWLGGYIGDTEILKFEVPMQQLKRRVYKEPVNPGTGLKVSYSILDQFYFTRIWGVLPNGSKIELRTTFSEEIYDPKTPTAIIRQNDDGISIEVPLIYITRGSIGSEIEVEIFTTKGPINLDMAGYTPNSFSLQLGDTHANVSDSKYSAPFDSMDTMGVLSKDLTVGGSDGLSFTELQARNIDNSFIGEIPITEVQLENAVKRNGFDLVKSVDNLMNRIYLATRHLPQDSEGRFGSGMATAIQTVEVNMEEIAKSVHTADNRERVTILPTMLYELKDGVTRTVMDSERPEHKSDNVALMTTMINSTQYAYSPFHYVLDAKGRDFKLRPYYLDQPETVSKSFISENDTTQLSVSTSRYELIKVPEGYKLIVGSRVGASYKQLSKDLIFAQLSFRPYREIDDAFINGKLIGEIDGEYVWEFLIGTNHDLDELHHLIIDNFSMYSAVDRPYPVSLEDDFKILYSVANYSVYGLKESELDNLIGLHLLPEDVTAISGEVLRLRLGSSLDTLWSNSRTVAASLEYLRHEYDVPKVHLETVLKTDKDGNIVLTDSGSGLDYEVIARAGEQVIVNGKPQWLHRKGDVVYDEHGQPKYVNDVRATKRQLDLLMIDGAYRYVTDSTDLKYRDEVPKTIVTYIIDQLKPLTGKLLGNTKLYFYPKSTLSDTKVTIGEETIFNIGNSSRFKVTYGLNGTNYRNAELRDSISRITGEVINEIIQLPTVSTDRLMDSLKSRLGNEVLSIDVSKFGPKNNIAVFSYLDTSSRISIKRVLRSLPNGNLTIEEDIETGFIKFGA